MHDIICPNCGERFMGYDVAFDMSEYVLPLLYGDAKNEEAVRQVKFKYYVDEETILNSNPSMSPELIECSNPGGPGLNSEMFSFRVNGKILYEYVFNRSGFVSPKELEEILAQLKRAVDDNDFTRITPLNLSQISTLYHILFDVSDKMVGDISTDDEYVRTAIRILVYLYENRKSTQSLDLKVCIYSSNCNQLANYNVPDILFVHSGGKDKRIKKCCRFCGRELPVEFGYFKMKPVVLLGSHSAGKTSYLLSLLNTVMHDLPFVDASNNRVATTTLNGDFNLHAFMNNIDRFRKGLSPEKTDFQNVPILNLKVADTIYSFIDWPGEKFISGAGTDEDYVYKSRRVITQARHVMFFLPPEQIDQALDASEENVRFNIMDLQESLSWHLAFPERRKFKSLICVANKVDMLRGRSNTERLFDAIDSRNMINIYSGNAWRESEYAAIDDSMKNYIMQQHSALFGVLKNIGNFEKYYIPVAPYGYTVPQNKAGSGEKAEGAVILKGYLSGLPFLRILKTDKVI